MTDDLELIEKLEAGGVLDDDSAETEVEQTPAIETEEPAQQQVDVEAIRAQARAEARAEAEAEFAARSQAQATQSQSSTAEQEEQAELEKIADLQYRGEYLEAEKRRVALAEKRAMRAIQAQHGSALTSSGITQAVQDAKAKLADLPPEVAQFVEATVRDLGIQGPIPADLVQAVKQLSYGAAAMSGIQIGKPAPPRTVRAAGSETSPSASVSPIPSEMKNDAAAFERAFGKDALNAALKESA